MNAVIYARYSSDNQREESIEGQLRECKEFAEANDMTIVDTYIDRALSAKTDNRPEFQKMVKDSAKGAFELVIVWKLDRFARNRYDSAHYKAVLQKNGVKLVSATEKISQTPEGILLEFLLEGMAEYYSAELAEKVTRGLTENALKCKYNGGTLPIGYAIDENQFFVIDPLEALEREKSDLSVQIMKEEMSRPNLTKEQILFWIHKFRKLNPKRLEHRRRLINSFLNSVYLYDDKIIIDCNYKDGTETITFEEIENSALGSDLTSLAAPRKNYPNRVVFLWHFNQKDLNLKEARSVKKTVRCTVFSECNEASAEVRQIAKQYASFPVHHVKSLDTQTRS